MKSLKEILITESDHDLEDQYNLFVSFISPKLEWTEAHFYHMLDTFVDKYNIDQFINYMLDEFINCADDNDSPCGEDFDEYDEDTWPDCMKELKQIENVKDLAKWWAKYYKENYIQHII